MEDPQDLAKDALSQEQLQARNDALGLPSNFDANDILDSRNHKYNNTPHGFLSLKESIGNPIVGPNPGRKGHIANDGKRAVLDNSNEAIAGMSAATNVVKNPYKLMQPYSYNGDYDGHNFDKYYKSPFYQKAGFSPYRDNETLYNNNSTFMDEFSRATGNWGKLIATGFASGVTSWKDIISTGDVLGPDLKTSRSMQRYMAEGSSTKGGMTSFILNNFVNSGYSIGVGAEWLAEEYALAYLTAQSAGMAAPETLPAMGLSAIKYSRARALARGGFNIFENYKRGRAALRTYSEMRTAAEMRNVWNSTWYGKTLAGLGRVVNPLGSTVDAFRGVKYADNAYKATAGIKTAGAFISDMLDIKGAVTESKLEGGLVVLDTEQKLIEQYRAKNNGKSPEGEELQRIHDLALEEGYRDAKWNLPIILMTNKIMYETIFKHLKPSKVKFGDVLLDKSGAFTALTKKGFKVFKGTASETLGRYARAAIKPRTYGKFLKGYMQANVAEGLQENFQEAISGASIDNALRAYNSEDRGAYEAFMGDVWRNLKGQVSLKGAETFASGFVMGAMSAPVMAAPTWFSSTVYNNTIGKKDYQAYKKARYDNLKKTADNLNEMYKNVGKYFAPEMRNAVAQGNLAKDLYAAHLGNDFRTEKDAQAYARIEAIYTSLRTGNFDIMVDKFKEMQNMTPEEIEQAQGLEKGQGKKALEIMNDFVTRAHEVKKRYDAAPENPYDFTVFKEGSERREAMELAWQGFEESRRALIFGQATYDNNVRRTRDMAAAVASSAKPLENVDASHITNIMSPADAQREILLLTSEIDTLEKAEGTLSDESKKDLAYKKKYLEHLMKLESRLNQAEFAYDETAYAEFKEDLKKEGFDIDRAAPRRDENGSWEVGTVVHDARKDLNEPGSVAKIVDSDSTGYLLDNGEFVERDDVEPLSAKYLQEMFQVDATEGAREAYREFLTLIANENNDLVFNDKLEESFQMLLDFRAKNKENVNLVKYINYMNDPRGMLEVAARITKGLTKAHKEKLKSTINRMSKSIKKFELNRGIQELYKDGWYTPDENFGAIYNAIKKDLKELPVPQEFIQVSTGETFGVGTPQYNQALDVWNKHVPAIVESFKEQWEAEQKAGEAKTEVVSDDEYKDFVDNNKVTQERINAIAEKVVDNQILTDREQAILAGKGAEVEAAIKDIQSKREPVKSEVVTTDMTYDEYPQALKDLLEPAFQKFLTDNNITPEEVTEEMRENFLGTITASRIIQKWNADTKKKEMEAGLIGKRRSAAEPPALTTVPLPKGKTLNDYTLPQLDKMLKDLQASQVTAPTPEKENDINLLDRYIKYRKSIIISTPGTEAQKKSLESLQKIQNEVINKDEDGKSYLILNQAYQRATNVSRMMMELVYNYKRDPFSSRAEANIVTSLAKEIMSRNGTPKDFISELRKSAINDVVLGKYNKRKLDKIQEYLEVNGFTEENVLDIFDKFQNEHTTIRGNNVDKHIRQFFETGELGPRPSYFSAEAWTNLDRVLNDIRNKFAELGHTVVAKDLTVFDNEALVAGSLDILVIDQKGNYIIYDIKTGSKSKWNKYEKPSEGMPHSADKMENTFQLSIYKRLLQNQTGIDVKALGIIPIEVTEDLDGNILSLDAPMKDEAGVSKRILINYDERVEELIPARTNKPVPQQQEPGEQETKVLVTVQAKIGYFKSQIARINKVQGQISNRMLEVEKDLDKESDELTRSRQELLKLQTFVDKASPKELKGKKQAIKTEIKRLQERVKTLEANHELLSKQQTKLANTRKRLSILENTILDAIDELPKEDVAKVKVEKKSVQDYIRESMDKINNMLNQRAMLLSNQIDTIEDRILSISADLEKMGVVDAMIDLYLAGGFSVEYIKNKLAVGNMSEAETKKYNELLKNLTENPEFRTLFKKLTRELSKSYIERAKLQFQYDELSTMKDRTPLTETSTQLDFLREAMIGLEELEVFTPEKKAPETPSQKPPAGKAPVAPSTKEKAPVTTTKPTPAVDLSSYIGKVYQSAKDPSITYLITGSDNNMLVVVRQSDGYVAKWDPKVVEAQKTADNPSIYEVVPEDEEEVPPPPPAAPTTDAKAAQNLNTVFHQLGLRDLKVSDDIFSAPIKSISKEAAFRNVILQILEYPYALKDIDFSKYLNKEDLEKVEKLRPIAKEFYQLNTTLRQKNIDDIKKYVELNQKLQNGIIEIFTPYLKQFGKNVKFEYTTLPDVNLTALEGKPSEEEGVLTFTDNNPELILNGKKKLTNRKHGLDKDGVYTIQRKDTKTDKATPTNIQVKIAKLGEAKVNTEGVVPEVSIEGNHVDTLKGMGIAATFVPSTNTTVIDADTYAQAEGFENWKDFEANNKDAKNFINGTQGRFIFTVEPVQKPKPSFKPEPTTTRSKEDIAKLKSVGLTKAIIKKLTDAEFEQALTFESPEDAIELIEKYHVPIPKEVITLDQAKAMIDGALSYTQLKDVYNKILRAASFNKLDSPMEVQEYYQEKLNERMMNPFAEDLQVGTLVEVEGDIYKVTKMGKTITLKQLAGDNVIKVPSAETSQTITRIVDPTTMEEEPTPEVNKDEVQPIKTTLETSSESTPEQNLENLKRGEEYKNDNDTLASYKKKPCNS